MEQNPGWNQARPENLTGAPGRARFSSIGATGLGRQGETPRAQERSRRLSPRSPRVRGRGSPHTCTVVLGVWIDGPPRSAGRAFQHPATRGSRSSPPNARAAPPPLLPEAPDPRQPRPNPVEGHLLRPETKVGRRVSPPDTFPDATPEPPPADPAAPEGESGPRWEGLGVGREPRECALRRGSSRGDPGSPRPPKRWQDAAIVLGVGVRGGGFHPGARGRKGGWRRRCPLLRGSRGKRVARSG